MPAPTLFDRGTRIILDGTRCTYEAPIIPDRHHVVVERTGEGRVVSEVDLAHLYSEGKLLIAGRRPLNKYDTASGPEPGTVLNDMEHARAWFTREWDKQPTALSTPALDRFINDNYPRGEKSHGLKHKPSAGALRRAIRQRGEPNRRPSRCMKTLRGKVPRASKFPETVEKVLRRYVAWHWSERSRKALEAHAMVRCMLERLNRWGRQRHGAAWNPYPVPSYETVRCRINQAECRATWEAKYSAREAASRFQGSDAGLSASKILETVVIDATKVDGWCVWRDETVIPLGRPTLYIAIDVYSRQIIAWHITFEPESLYGLMALLKKIVTPNPAGVWGKPDTIIFDNGWANVSPSFQDAVESAGISIDIAPARIPEAKALCERTFGTLNKLLFHKLLGGSVPFGPQVMRELALQPMKTANITMAELDETATYAIREVYANKRHSGTRYIPQLLWERGLVDHGRRMVDDLPALTAHFGQVEECTLTRSGVRTKDGLRFYDADVVSRLLNSMARDTPSRKRRKGSATVRVKVIVNPEDVSSCVVWDHIRKQAETLRNLHTEFGSECSSRWEYKMLRRYADATNASFKTDAEQTALLRSLRMKIEQLAPAMMSRAAKRMRNLLAEKIERAPGGRLIVEAEAPASPNGLKPASNIRTVKTVSLRTDDRIPPGHRRGGQKAVDRQNRPAAKRKNNVEGASHPASVLTESVKTVPALPAPGPASASRPARDPRSVQSLSWVKPTNTDD